MYLFDNVVCSLLTVHALQVDDGSAKVLGGDVWGLEKVSEVVLWIRRKRRTHRVVKVNFSVVELSLEYERPGVRFLWQALDDHVQ